STPLANILAMLRAVGAAFRLRHAHLLAAAELDRFAVPADDREAVLSREHRRVVGAEDRLLFACGFVGAAAGVVVHLIDLPVAAEEAVRVAGGEERFVRSVEVLEGGLFAHQEKDVLRSEERRVGKECRCRWWRER